MNNPFIGYSGYRGLARSPDGGGAWQRTYRGCIDELTLVVPQPGDPEKIYGGGRINICEVGTACTHLWLIGTRTSRSIVAIMAGNEQGVWVRVLPPGVRAWLPRVGK
jgi:hypothetical protein